MSGDGLISVRLPRSLFELLRAALQRSGRDLHGGARFLISYLDCLSPNELASMPEPPNETENPRVPEQANTRKSWPKTSRRPIKLLVLVLILGFCF
jgi:hypothetical protein